VDSLGIPPLPRSRREFFKVVHEALPDGRNEDETPIKYSGYERVALKNDSDEDLP
jgi:hypothetical protein